MELLIRDKNRLVVAYDSMYAYPEFEALLNKYGKDDDVLDKIIKYIFFTCDPKATPQQDGYNPKEGHRFAIKNSGLTDKFVVTEEIKKAQWRYREKRTNAMHEYIETVISSLRVGSKTCKIIIENQKVDEDVNKEMLASIIDSVNSVLTLSSKINAAIPMLIKNLEEIKALEATEEANKADDQQRGGGDIPDSYEGDPEIEGYD